MMNACMISWLLVVCMPDYLASGIEPDSKFAWQENIGWTNWLDAGDPNEGVHTDFAFLHGFIWSEGAGFINMGNGNGPYDNLDDSTFGVNLNPDGTLSGFAWAENIGWIRFGGDVIAETSHAAMLSACGQFTGFAWSENAGWLNLACAEHAVVLENQPLRCDVSNDRLINAMDIQPFVDLLLFGNANSFDICAGDLAAPKDGVIDVDDLMPFVHCLLSDCGCPNPGQ